MLGALAGFWIAIIFSAIALFVVIAVAISGNTDSAPTEIKDKSILHIKLSGAIEERKTSPQLADELYGDKPSSAGLNNIIKAITDAAEDKNISGIYLDCDGVSAGIATRKSIVDALINFKESGKWIVSYSDLYTQGDYYIACASDSIFLNPVGSVDVHGLSSTTFFFKDMLDKIGIEAQIIKVGTFKSAVEPFVLNEMSEPNRKQQQHYLNRIWTELCAGISEMRNVAVEEINSWADSLIVTQDPKTYHERKIVDKLCYRHQFEDVLKRMCGVGEDEDLRLITPNDYCHISNTKDFSGSDNKIAVLYAVGDIVDSGDGGIVGRDMAPLILDLAEDDDIKGLVLRVNSGGGSAFASEQIWEALEEFKKTGKPFYASMGDVAASGGYYISCGADRIYAEPVTLTGSIGIFGIIPCVKGLLNDKLGIHTSSVSTNANGNFPLISEPMTDIQRFRMQENINRGYELFVSRCAEGRDMPVDSIKLVAEGRVWDGMTAHEIGLVDKMGGLGLAIDDMVSELGLEDHRIIEYPSPEFKWWEQITSLSTSYKENVIANELGTIKPLYDAVKRIDELAPIQCRMEYINIE